MTFRGTVQNGKVVLDEGAELPEGAKVDVRVVRGRRAKARPATRKGDPSSWLSLLEFSVSDKAPKDFAHQVDHYVYGGPRKPARKARSVKKSAKRRDR
jgi:hypothetical protein